MIAHLFLGIHYLNRCICHLESFLSSSRHPTAWVPGLILLRVLPNRSTLQTGGFVELSSLYVPGMGSSIGAVPGR
jgi:hypothetical protein